MLREEQEKVTCGGRPESMSIIAVWFSGVVMLACWTEVGDERRERLTGNITHPMITEHRFTPFVTRHVRHYVLLPSIVHVRYTAYEGKADACVVIVAYWSFFC